MSEVFKNRKINSPFGIFFQIAVFNIAIFGLYNILEKIYYSLTNFNLLEKPTFVGFENYSNIFKDDVVQKCLSNTVFMVCVVAILLLITAVLPAIFTSKLKLPFGLGVIGALSFVSICAMLPNLFNMIFSGDSYGLLNSWLLSNSIINEPIIFPQTHARMLAIFVLWLFCLAPVFSITYIAARKKQSFWGSVIAVCLIPVLMYKGGGIVNGVVGSPSTNYSADWLYTIFKDYLMIRLEISSAYAILVVGLIMLVFWCALVCSSALGLRVICKKINANHLTFKVFGFITFALSLLSFAFILIFITSRTLMPLDEILAQPISIAVKRPTLQNFYSLGKFLSETAVPFSTYLGNSLFFVPVTILPVCLFTVLPSGVGFGLFKVFNKQKLLLLCFIPFLFVSSYLTLSKLGIVDTRFVYMFEFLSSLEFLIAVFLVYLAVKLVFYTRKPSKNSILLGVFFILSSFYAIGAIRGIWYSSDMLYSENLKLWNNISAYISAGGIARSGVAAANDMLMLFATIVVVVIPLILLLQLYRLYRKNTNDLIEK